MNGSLWVKLTDNIECVINNKTICLWVFYWIAKSIWYSWSQHFTWKNSYTSVAEKTKVNVNYSSKHFSEYMENNSLKSLFLSPTNKNEIWSIISGFNPNKALGPNNIPKKIPKVPIKDGISSNLSDIYNHFFYGCMYSHHSWKLPKPFLYIKMTLSWTAITIIQYLFYQILKKKIRKTGI